MGFRARSLSPMTGQGNVATLKVSFELESEYPDFKLSKRTVYSRVIVAKGFIFIQ